MIVESRDYNFINISKNPRLLRLFNNVVNHILGKFKEDAGLTLKKKYLGENGKIDFRREENKYGFPYGRAYLEFNEIPEWKFGIDFSYYELKNIDLLDQPNSDVYRGDYVSVEMYAQNKLYIDKFKYTRSEFTMSARAKVEYKEESNGNRVYGDDIEGIFISNDKYKYYYKDKIYTEPFQLIWKHPDVAFYKHMYGGDLNENYVPEEEAKKFKEKFLAEEKEQLDLLKAWKTETLLAIQKKVNEEYGIPVSRINLSDSGVNTSPRYSVLFDLTPQEFVMYSEDLYFLVSETVDKMDEIFRKEELAQKFLVFSPMGHYLQIIVNGENKYYLLKHSEFKAEDMDNDTALLLMYNAENGGK